MQGASAGTTLSTEGSETPESPLQLSHLRNDVRGPGASDSPVFTALSRWQHGSPDQLERVRTD